MKSNQHHTNRYDGELGWKSQQEPYTYCQFLVPPVDIVSETFSGVSLGKRKTVAYGRQISSASSLDVSKRGRCVPGMSVSGSPGMHCPTSLYLEENTHGSSPFMHAPWTHQNLLSVPPRQRTHHMDGMSSWPSKDTGTHFQDTAAASPSNQPGRRRRREKATLFSKPWEAFPFEEELKHRKPAFDGFKRRKKESSMRR